MAGSRGSRQPLFSGPASQRAAAALRGDVELLRRTGYAVAREVGPLEFELTGSGRPALRLRMAPDGRVFGGTYALELSTAAPVLPRSGGLVARGRGLVRMAGVSFRARRGDAAGRALAQRLEADRELCERLARVHFERIRVEPDGTPVIRHMGGSLVWILFPPVVKRIPLVPEQAEASVRALEAFAAFARGGG
jgi:hypothetical protein